MRASALQLFVALVAVACLAFESCGDQSELFKLFKLPSKEARREDLYQRKRAPRHKFASYVSLRRRALDLHYCAGTLISPRFILTSASCVDPGVSGFGVEMPSVDIGTFLLDSPDKGQKTKASGKEKSSNPLKPQPEYNMTIVDVIIHEKYSNGSRGRPPYDARHDIALLKLKKPSSLCWALLPFEEPDCCDDEDLLNVGLGRFESESGPYAKSLEMAVFPHLPYKKCKSYFRARPPEEFFARDMRGNLTASASLCVSGAGEYCQLDHGSSLVRYNSTRGESLMVGLANEATRECSYGAPYVFSSISSHMEWIVGVKGVVKDISGSFKRRRACEEKEIVSKVAGGTDAQSGRFPYAVSVRRTAFQNTHVCQGVLISPTHVLTAASCISVESRTNPTATTVYIGGINTTPQLDSDGELIQAEEIIVHPQYRANKNLVDLAIVVLEKNSTKTPVRLPVQSRDCCENGTTMRVFGWGSESLESRSSGVLQTGEMEYIPRKQCVSVHGVQDVNRKAICAGAGPYGASLCRGDYGTPLLLTAGAEDILIGIGFTNATGNCDAPSEFLRIAFFMRWIKQYVSVV